MPTDAEIQALSPEERLRLIELLWSSFVDDASPLFAADAQGAEIRRRLDRVVLAAVAALHQDRREAKSESGLSCSFCGKGQREVAKLIAGPTVYICDECIDLCNEIICEEYSAPDRHQ